MGKNLEVLKNFIEQAEKLYNEARDSNDEDAAREAIRTLRTSADNMMWQGDEFTYADKLPHIVEDIVHVFDLEDTEYDLDDGELEILVEKVLDFDYSDYNNAINDLIEELISERAS